MDKYHAIANELKMTTKQRVMYFRLGAEVENAKRVKMGFAVDPNYCHGVALGALEAVDWKSLKAARAIITVTRGW